MFVLGSTLALLLGAATLVLQVFSLKTKNPFFQLASKRILTLALSIVFIPTLLLCYVQEDYGKLAVSAAKAEWEMKREESKFISQILLRWKAGGAKDRSQIAQISSIVKERLERAGKEHLIVSGNFDRISSYTSIKTPNPGGFDPSLLPMVISAAVTATLKLEPEITKATFPATERFDEMLSVRSVHPGQERMALAGYPDAPEGFTRMPWKDGFVYVSTSYHINESGVSNAQPYLDNSLLLTLTPEGLSRMQAMAYSLSTQQMQVAVIYKGRVRGVYEPQICTTDQFIIPDIPETPQQLKLEADVLSQPRGFGDVAKTEFIYSYRNIPENDSFPLSLYRWLCSDSLNNLWLIVYAVLMLAVSLLIVYLHVKTRPPVLLSKF